MITVNQAGFHDRLFDVQDILFLLAYRFTDQTVIRAGFSIYHGHRFIRTT